MTLLAIILALLIEQARPLASSRMDAQLERWGNFLDIRFNAGEHRHGVIAWLIGAALPAVLVFAAYWILVRTNIVAALLFSIGSLYLTMGFRQFSHYFTDIHLALRMGEVDRARKLLAEWRNIATDHLGSNDIARLAIEHALVATHQYVFAPLFWFFLLGPAGPLLYRLSRHFDRQWSGQNQGGFGDFAHRAFAAIDWLPVRLTAASFAVVGNFEDAVFCWRSQAAHWPDQGSGILLATGAGAIGIKLGMPIPGDNEPAVRPELGEGDEADFDHMQSAIGLVWRSLVMALLLLALLGIASWA